LNGFSGLNPFNPWLFRFTMQAKPHITVSPTKVLHRNHVDLRGSGFTPNSNVSSHLRRSDGTEFPVLPMQTDEKGEIYHDIDTLILEPGIHQVWIIDDRSKVSSNVAQFEVVLDPR
jgi:hypothetical protein